jgi:hypothetical protein
MVYKKMELKYLLICILLCFFNSFSQDTLEVASVRINITYNKTGVDLLKKGIKCDTNCIVINKLNVELTDRDKEYWQNLLKFVKNDYGDLIGAYMSCGGPAFTWNININLKNKQTLSFYLTSEDIASSKNIVYFINDVKKRYLDLDPVTYKNFCSRLINLVKHGFQFSQKDIDCGC